MKSLTIFTPAYNRAYSLPKLYDSLLRQTSFDFEWIIVDDGSIDNTRILVESWVENCPFPILYTYQCNSGKMQAHNKGVQMSNTELFVCVDSDDYLTDDAVEFIISSWSNTEHDDTTVGLVAYKKMIDNEGNISLSKEFPKGIVKSSLYNLYQKGFKGETTLVFRTKIIAQYLFPKFGDEKFIPENYVYDQIDLQYEYVILNKALIVCQYMSDGYTLNLNKLYANNPRGVALSFNQRNVLPNQSFREYVKNSMLYVIYAKKAGMNGIYKNAKKKGVIYLIAKLFSVIYRNKY